MTSHKWLIDFDSVLSNTFIHQIEALNARFGTNHTNERFTSWTTTDFLSDEEIAYFWGDEVFLNEDFQMECMPVEGGRDILRKIILSGGSPYVVSDRPVALERVTRAWIRKHIGFDLPLILTRSSISKSDQDVLIPTKQQVASMLDLSRVVEDAPHHVKAFNDLQFSSIERIYLMDTPANQEIVDEGKIYRVKSWAELYAYEKGLVPA